MSGKLNTFVHVHRDGETKAFGPADTVPEWAAALITNPDVWETPPVKAEIPDDGAGNGGNDQSGAGTGGDGQSGAQGAPTPPTEVPIPPKGGKGSSATAWAAYAESKGFGVDADAKASDIIDALAEAGIPTE